MTPIHPMRKALVAATVAALMTLTILYLVGSVTGHLQTWLAHLTPRQQHWLQRLFPALLIGTLLASAVIGRRLKRRDEA
jgi:threonine/homoserine/homoserine lactone efflux protein